MKLDKKLSKLINLLVTLEDSLNVNIVTWETIKDYSETASYIENKDTVIDDKELLSVSCACNLNTFSLVFKNKEDKLIIAFECNEENSEIIGKIIQVIMNTTETENLIVKTGGVVDLVEKDNIIKYIRGEKY